MSNHVGMVNRAELSEWMRTYGRTYAASAADGKSLSMVIYANGCASVMHGDTELYRGTDIDAAIKAWDGAGDKSRLGNRQAAMGMPPKLARAALSDDALVILHSRNGWWRAIGDGHTLDSSMAYVFAFGDVRSLVGGTTTTHPVIPD